MLRNPHPYLAKISPEHPIVITEVWKGTPAERSGLQVGDKMMAIDGKSTDGLMRRNVLAMLGSEEGTPLHLRIERLNNAGTPEIREIATTPESMKVAAARYESLGDGVGYVQLKNFVAQDVDNQMFMALGASSNDKALIIDLRDDNGGSVLKMEQIAQQILEKGSVYRLEQRDGDGMRTEIRRLADHVVMQDTISGAQSEHLEYNRMAERIVSEDKPIVVLIDAYTLSCAELLAGILKHNKRATLVGMPTTGKREGQQPVALPYGRAADLTDFEFFPAEQPVPKGGIEPDVRVPRGADPRVDNQLIEAKRVALELAARK